jgi:hypothetical protein
MKSHNSPLAPVLLYSSPFLGEAELAVQPDRGRIVREYLKAQFVQPASARPANRRLQRRANPVPAPVALDEHPSSPKPWRLTLT